MRLPIITLAALLSLVSLPTTSVEAGPGGQMSPGKAGEIARKQTGGRVLAVKAADGGYRVKVLTPNGQVRYVFVPAR